MTDKNTVRSEFPILDEKIYGKSLIYLDNAATTQKPRCVVEQLEHGYYHINANVHRGVHFLSQQATEAHEVSRRSAQTFINAADPSEIIFTQGTTGSINLIASSYGKAFMQPGDEVIVTAMEHHSNIVPWQLQGFVLKVIPLTESGELDIDALPGLFTSHTRMVAVTHVSNVLGTVNPVAEIVRIAHEHGVPTLIDGAQAVAHQQVDVQNIDADFYAFSGHKIYGPTGIGILFGKAALLDAMPPYQGGGEMIESVSFEKTTYNTLPYKFEAGTPDFVGTPALATALHFVENIGWQHITEHEAELLSYATERLKAVGGVRIFGEAQNRSGVISFLIDGVHPYDAGIILDRLGVAIRTGHHCAEPLMKILGVEGLMRASFAVYNTRDDVDALIAGIEKIKTMF